MPAGEAGSAGKPAEEEDSGRGRTAGAEDEAGQRGQEQASACRGFEPGIPG